MNRQNQVGVGGGGTMQPSPLSAASSNSSYAIQPNPNPNIPKQPWGRRIKDSLKARWAGYPVAAVLVVTSWLVGHFANARNRFFVENDPTLSYPYHRNTVPSWSLVFIGAVGPIAIIILTQVMIRRSPRAFLWDRRTKDIHLAIIVLGEVLAITWLITNILKVYVGRLRPNFYAYCDYLGYRDAVATGNMDDYLAATRPGRIGDYSKCRDHNNDAHFSFPSGHSSISFCGLTFLTLFLLHATADINFRHHGVGKVLRLSMVLIPLIGAAFVAASRIMDYAHAVEDTLWGASIGVIGAVIAFHANYAYQRPNVPGVPITGGDMPNMFGRHEPQREEELNEIREARAQANAAGPGGVAFPTTRALAGEPITQRSPLVTRMSPANIDV